MILVINNNKEKYDILMRFKFLKFRFTFLCRLRLYENFYLSSLIQVNIIKQTSLDQKLY